MPCPDLTDVRVLITGAAARVGKTTAEYLAECGADVAIHYRTSEESARSMRDEFRDMGVRCDILQADLADFEEMSDLVERADDAIGPVNCLVNNAAIWRETPFGQVSDDQWSQLFDVNLRAPYFLTQQFARRAAGRPGACVVNMVDVFACRPLVDYSAYGMTKAALKYMTEVLSVELAPDIRINGIAPGTVLLNEDHDADIADELEDQIPMGLTGGPEDVAEIVAFLIGGPDYITGEIIAVDGARRHVSV